MQSLEINFLTWMDLYKEIEFYDDQALNQIDMILFFYHRLMNLYPSLSKNVQHTK